MKEKEIQNLKLKLQGLELEYQYVNELKDKRIQQLQEKNNYYKREVEENKYYKKEFEELCIKMEQYKNELERIKNSRWWKIRESIKGNKLKE